MRRSWIAMVATLSLLALTPLPANASHPHQAGQSYRTGKAGELYISPEAGSTVVTQDGPTMASRVKATPLISLGPRARVRAVMASMAVRLGVLTRTPREPGSFVAQFGPVM